MKHVLIQTSIGVAVFLAFQNCGGPTPVSSISLESSFEETCVESSCQSKAKNLFLSIGNQIPIRFMAPDTNVEPDIGFDVGGFCDFSEFDKTKIYFELKSTAGESTIPLTASQGCSKLGRFRFRVNFPSGFNYLQTYVLRVWLRGLDGKQEVDNPSGQSYQEIPVTPIIPLGI